MKVLVCEAPGELSYAEKDLPVLKKGEALIQIKRIGICGTDLHAYEGTQPYFTYPRILGHELSGEIVDANGADGLQKGDNVTIIPYFNCDKCIACRGEKPNCCVSMQVCGVHIDGGMVEYLKVPHNALIGDKDLSLNQLALIEPLAIGAHGIRRANVQQGEYVLVIGAGPIGLGVMEFARIAGGEVIALDINQSRLDFCKEPLNVTHTVNALEADVVAELNRITNSDMPTVVIDCTGSLKAINNGFNYLAHGGRYVLVGLQKGEICFSHPEFHKREATLMSSRNATRADFEHVINALKKGLIDPINYITHRVAFDHVKTEFKNWLDPANGVIKAMVEIA
ncbi:zinc-binding alcohol dehydrogenase family protein [Mucilaginibacter achroorhodeus]|uniref:Zinc-binding alcohol dehydrogenase family protein n=1 Tax=Mucilaginibacter achroorhodeus TaxID=2599294 RepID=A0A563U4J9_9SPHI|nr:zinc-binding alcohol dehydrogenase family protein [Mucilaginibacter achroorhodeus]TWR26245.1 zinc-binding alcohol dehydrogenase family protein [Mucilaginibacter achroorhodeus]